MKWIVGLFVFWNWNTFRDKIEQCATFFMTSMKVRLNCSILILRHSHKFQAFISSFFLETILSSTFCNAFCWNYKYLFSKINKFWAYLSVFMSIICQKVVSNSKYKIESTSCDIKKFSFQLLQFQNNATKSLTLHSQEKKFCIHLFFFIVCGMHSVYLF